MKPKISLVTLEVTDFAKALAFYRDGLVFPAPRYQAGENVAFFELDGAW